MRHVAILVLWLAGLVWATYGGSASGRSSEAEPRG